MHFYDLTAQYLAEIPPPPPTHTIWDKLTVTCLYFHLVLVCSSVTEGLFFWMLVFVVAASLRLFSDLTSPAWHFLSFIGVLMGNRINVGVNEGAPLWSRSTEVGQLLLWSKLLRVSESVYELLILIHCGDQNRSMWTSCNYETKCIYPN